MRNKFGGFLRGLPTRQTNGPDRQRSGPQPYHSVVLHMPSIFSCTPAKRSTRRANRLGQRGGDIHFGRDHDDTAHVTDPMCKNFRFSPFPWPSAPTQFGHAR